MLAQRLHLMQMKLILFTNTTCYVLAVAAACAPGVSCPAGGLRESDITLGGPTATTTEPSDVTGVRHSGSPRSRGVLGAVKDMINKPKEFIQVGIDGNTCVSNRVVARSAVNALPSAAPAAWLLLQWCPTAVTALCSCTRCCLQVCRFE